MRELEVLDQGHLQLCWEERKEFFEEELGERARSEVKRLLEEAWEAERTHWLGVAATCGTRAKSAKQISPGPAYIFPAR